MRPAFSSTGQAAAFGLLLLALLLAPALAGKKFLPPRGEIYSSIPWSAGDFPYLADQIFREKGDMDIVFMGASHIWAGFNTPHVQEQLSQRLGRVATVRTFGWGWPSCDAIYFAARDLLAHHRVRMLVVDDDCGELDEPHPLASHFFRFGDDAAALEGLPLSIQAMYYFAAVAGMPHNLLGLARSNLPADLNARSYWENRANAPNLADRLGSIAARAVFKKNARDNEPFARYVPKTNARPSDVCIYSPETIKDFAFSSAGIPPLQLHFMQKLAALAREYHCKLVIVHIPIFDERRSTVISQSAFWPVALHFPPHPQSLSPKGEREEVTPHAQAPADVHGGVTIVGIPPAKLFQCLTDDQIRMLYSDAVHLNENGQDYFTVLMTPTLLKIYESQNR